MEDKYKTHGDLSWCELLSRDVEGSKKFYGDLLGWEMEDCPSECATTKEQMTYTVVKAKNGKGVGGIMPMPSNVPDMVPTHWGAYITVDDVDAVAKKAQELGAETLVPPTDIPNCGKFYCFKDPQGAVLSVISYKDMPESDV